jgi:hypothetical protein
VKGVKSKVTISSILVVSIVSVMVLALLLSGCKATTFTSSSPTLSPSSVSPQGSSVVSSPTTPTGISLTVSEPQDNTITDVDTIEVKGHTDPQAVVSVNEEITTVDANGNFTATVNLEEGPNTIEVVASDEEGNQASVNLIVTLVKGG